MYKIIGIVLLLTVFLVGCQSDSETKKDLEPQTLAQLYEGDLSKVDQLLLIDGSSGERRAVTDLEVVQQWVNAVKDIVLVPVENQEGRVGYRYRIQLLEGEQIMLDFTPNNIAGVYYKDNEAFAKATITLFEQQFGER